MPRTSTGRDLRLAAAAVALLLAAGFAAEPAKAVRVPWMTSRVTGSPDPPPPFRVVRAS